MERELERGNLSPFPHIIFISTLSIHSLKCVKLTKFYNLTIKRKNLLFRLTVTYTEVVYPARILPNQTAKPVAETQKLAECIYDCRTLLQQILTDGLTVLQNSKPAPSYQQHKAGLSKQPWSNLIQFSFIIEGTYVGSALCDLAGYRTWPRRYGHKHSHQVFWRSNKSSLTYRAEQSNLANFR